MRTQRSYSRLASALVVLLCLLTIRPALADDTDIYINNTTTGSEPLVMFTLDWRPNLGSTICNFSVSSTNYAGIASACGTAANGWTASFVQNYFTASDLSDGKITFFELLRAVLRQTMAPLDGVKVGLMMNHNNNCTGGTTSGPSLTGCSNGAYILSGFKSMVASDSNGNKAAFYNLLASIPDPSGNSHPFQGKELYFELFRYLTGQEVYNGHLGWKDFGNTNASDNLNGEPTTESPDYSAIAWDALNTENIQIDTTTGKPMLDSKGNPIDILDANGIPTYVSPLTSGMTCAKIYVINIMFQVSQSEDDSDAAISDTKANGGMNGLVLKGSSNNFDTVINWMYKNDLADGTYGTAPNISGTQNVVSYFLSSNVNTTTNGYATAGGTGNAIALGSDPATLTNTLKNIFSQILSVSTTFVSASVPVNVFNRADYLNDVYLALFQADQNANPRWIGNLKKLELMQDSTGAWYIGDVNAKPAFAADGRINYDALTFWTDPTGWDVVKADPTQNEISGYDGRSVNRGGAGQQIPGFLSGSVGTYNTDTGARQVFTEPSTYTNGTATTLMALDATSTNASALWNDLDAQGIYSSGTTLNNTAWSTATTYSSASAGDQAEALNILKWARGYDVMDENANGSTTDTRPWLMADPIHSTPLTINYGANTTGYSATNPDVRIIITGNDGFVHMVQNTDTAGSESGKENWAFIPRYGMRILDRMMRDGLDPSSVLHPYGVDGAPVAYVYDANHDGNIIAADGDKAYLYFGLRRGGRAYYAMDITDPDKPKMLWSISNNTTNFSQLGLTFSTPKVATMSYAVGGVTYYNQPVLIFGGGYDTNKDTRSNSVGSSDSMGNAIFIVNALDGSLVWKAVQGSSTGNVSATTFQNKELTDSIPSDVTVLDSNGDGNVDRIYVGDTGGQVFRADVAGTDRTKWTLRVFASIGRHDQNGKGNDRRFFHAPDVVQSRDAIGPFDGVIIGSGDRANPLDNSIGTKIPNNWFYMFKDRDIVSGTTSFVTPLYTMGTSTTTSTSTINAQLADLTSDCVQTSTCTAATLSALDNYGWQMDMVQAVGEKVLSRPITINGIIYFTTYLPPNTSSTSGSCSPSEGTGLKYAVNLQDATAAYNWDLTNTTTDAAGNVVDLGATDRFSATGVGIPADVISIRKSGNIQVLTPGDNYLLQAKGTSGYRTYWYTLGE